MKKLHFIVLIVILSKVAVGQSFKVQTNAISIDTDNLLTYSELPRINWIKPQFESSNSDKNEILLEVLVTSEEPIESIDLIITQKDKQDIIKKYPRSVGLKYFEVEQTVTLRDGQYNIILNVKTNKGGAVRSARELNVGLDAVSEAVSMNRKDRALLFATDKYDYWNDLVNPVYDANTIAEILSLKYGFDVEIIENPNQEDVFIKLGEYAQQDYKPQDQLMIFFAGHGFFDETFGEGYVVAKNSLENDKAKTTFISHSRLRAIINNISCEHILLTMDVCFGGTFDPLIASERSLQKTIIDNDAEFLARKLSYKTRKYITSGGKTYVSDGVRGKHSPFAQRIIKALEEGKGTDQILTLGEIKPYIEKLIPEPRMGSFGNDHIASDFIFVESIEK